MAEAKNTIPESASAAPLYKLEDIWLNAFAQLPDAKPLVDLLRDYSKPMPPGVRDLLAELLDPGKPDICGGRLVYEATSGLRRAVDEGLPLVVSYRAEAGSRKGAAMPGPSQQAARAAGKKYRRSDRTVYRKLQAWRELVARLHGRER